MFITSLIQCRICIFHSKVKNLRGHEHITQPKSSNFTHEESQLFGNGGHPFIPFPPEVAVCDEVAEEFEEPTHIHGLCNKDFFYFQSSIISRLTNTMYMYTSHTRNIFAY